MIAWDDAESVDLGSRVLYLIVRNDAVSITLGSRLLLLITRDGAGDAVVLGVSMGFSGSVRFSCIANSCSALRTVSPACSDGYVADDGLDSMETMSPAAWRK